MVYTLPNGSFCEFFSTDDEQKIRGRKRDILYCNEGNEISFRSDEDAETLRVLISKLSDLYQEKENLDRFILNHNAQTSFKDCSPSFWVKPLAFKNFLKYWS